MSGNCFEVTLKLIKKNQSKYSMIIKIQIKDVLPYPPFLMLPQFEQPFSRIIMKLFLKIMAIFDYLLVILKFKSS